MDIDVYAELQKESHPIFIYGAGNLAHQIHRKMKQYGIEIAGVITDSGREEFENLKVHKFSDIVDKYNDKEIVIVEGFASAYERHEELLRIRAFSNVYEIAIPFDHHAHFDCAWVNEHRQELSEAKQLLEDDYSKEVFEALLNAVSLESADCVRKVFKNEMSYFVNDVIDITDDEVFLDIGAYKGGSIAGFLNTVKNKYKKIIGIEPEKENYRVLEKYCEENGINADLYNIGCWFEKDTLCFEADDKISRLSDDGKVRIEVDRVDNIIDLKDEDGISLINLGVSVSEKEIIMGAQEIITKYKPRWIIYMGGAREELYSIPTILKKIMPSYKLYLRFIQAMPSRVILFVK